MSVGPNDDQPTTATEEAKTAPTGREVFDGMSNRTKVLAGVVTGLVALGGIATAVVTGKAIRGGIRRVRRTRG